MSLVRADFQTANTRCALGFGKLFCVGSEVVVVLPRGVEVPVGDDGAPTEVPESEREG